MAQVGTIVITQFDNELSLIYKTAIAYNTPVKYLIVIPLADNRGRTRTTTDRLGQINADVDFEPLIVAVRRYVGEGRRLREIYDILISNDQIIFKPIEFELAMVYFLVVHEQLEQNEELDEPHLTPILQEINDYFDQLKIPKRFSTINDLILAYSTWTRQYTDALDEDKKVLDRLIRFQDELGQLDALESSPLIYDTVEIAAHPQINGRAVTELDGIDIFNQSQLSDNIPYLQYNGDYIPEVVTEQKVEKYIKLYEGNVLDKMPNYSIIIPTITVTNERHRIYFTVWTGDEEQRKVTKDSYIKGEYNLLENTLSILSPINERKDESLMIRKIENVMPIILGQTQETKVSGSFDIYELQIVESSLLDAILTDELMNAYLYVEESNKPAANKKRLSVHFKSILPTRDSSSTTKHPSAVRVTLTQHYTETEVPVTLLTDAGLEKRIYPIGTPYVHVKMTKAQSRIVGEQFKHIFTRLLQYYNTERIRGEIESLYRAFFPNVEPVPLPTKPMPSHKKGPGRRGPPGTKIRQLQELAPDLIVNGYARICQCPHQPLIIPHDEINIWEQQTFTYKGNTFNRQVLPFPRDNPKWYFVCSSEDYPFPGVKHNKDLPNKNEYPYVPCCFKENQMRPDAKSKYNEYYEQIERRSRVIKPTHRMITDKVLAVGRTGEVDPTIRNLLQKYTPNAGIFERYGVPFSPNSLLHSISIALDVPEYNNLTPEEREQYIINLRKQVAINTNPGLLKQELYDVSDSSINAALADTNIFLDPRLYFRAFEEYYNINLYVFTLNQVEQTVNQTGQIELPRFKLFYAHAPRPDRQAVLIFKHVSPDSSHCELIVESRNNLIIKLFDPEMTLHLDSTINAILSTITWSQQGPQFVPRLNLFTRINFNELIGYSATAQFLDNYGKLRALIFPVNNQSVTLIIPPSQPENLPVVPNIIPAPLPLILNLFSNVLPTGTLTQNNNLTGLWFPLLDLASGILCPIIPTSIPPELADLPPGPANPIITPGLLPVVPRLRKLKRDLRIILQIILWLYRLSQLPKNDFINQFLFTDQRSSITNSETIYNFTGLTRLLPQVASVDQAIDYLNRVTPSLIRNNKVYLYSRKFADGIFYFLTLFSKDYQNNNEPLPTQISGLYETEEDFTPQNYTAIFVGEEHMRSWLNSISRIDYNSIIIRNKLDLSLGLIEEPYLYQDEDDRIYLIQNVISGQFERAITVADNWLHQSYNLGYSAPLFDTQSEDIPPYVIYGISKSNSLIIINDKTNNTQPFLELLSYGVNQFAAMLRLR